MKKLTIKNTHLEVSRLCFGGCPMGGHGWGESSEQEFIDAINRALDIGVNFFDTSDTYGLGEAERILGETVKDRRGEVVIVTKFGVRVEGGRTFYDNSPEWIETAVQNSLKRLQTDYIDVYKIHYRDGVTPLSVVVEKLEELKSRGLIKHYGISNINADDIEELMQYKSKFVSFQNEFSLATRKNEADMFKLSNELDMNPMTWGSLGQGILTGTIDENTVFGDDDRRSRPEYVNFHGEKLKHNLEIVEVLRELSVKYDKSLSAIAIRWILDYIPNSIVIAGIKNVNELEMNATALGWKLEEEDIKRLEEVSDYNLYRKRK